MSAPPLLALLSHTDTRSAVLIARFSEVCILHVLLCAHTWLRQTRRSTPLPLAAPLRGDPLPLPSPPPPVTCPCTCCGHT